MRHWFIFTALILVSQSALAQGESFSSKPTKERKVCRAEADLGSLITRSTCNTPAQWKIVDGANIDHAQTEMRPIAVDNQRTLYNPHNIR